MDFFSHQDAARKRTRWLVVLYLSAVFLIVVVVNVVTQLALGASEVTLEDQLGLFPWVTTLTLLVIASGTAYKIWRLGDGGSSVALMLGGRLLDGNTRDADERRLLNVIEEMAIASGVPMPQVYVMEKEYGINAFAAGFTPGDTVIGVTEGCMKQLSRDELQGVIAHEFSHILNGDVRLNLRLIGVLHGILLISMIGEIVMRSLRFSGGSSSNRKGGGLALGVFVLGLALFLVGYIGVFFGRMIKSAISRQREYLADASAVQFTRNPNGIAGALKKIGGLGSDKHPGSRIADRHAEEVSHLLFGAHRNSLFRFLATHPPLEERIRRIDASFDGTYPEVQTIAPGPRPEYTRPFGAAAEVPVSRLTGSQQTGSQQTGSQQASPPPPPPPSAAASSGAPPSNPEGFTARAGTLTEAHMVYARQLLKGLPQTLRDAAHEPYSARAVVYGLLLDRRSEVRREQLEILQRLADKSAYQLTERLQPLFEQVDLAARLPLVDLTLPALRRLSPAQYKEFREEIRHLALADERISIFELTLEVVLERHLAPHFEHRKRRGVQHYSLRRLDRPVAVLLSALARFSPSNETQAAFEAGTRQVQDVVDLQLLDANQCRLTEVKKALEELQGIAPLLKRRLLRAVAAVIIHDRRVELREGELLRAISDSLDTPMPPYLPEQPVA